MRASYGSVLDGDGPMSPYNEHDHEMDDFTNELSPMAHQLPSRQPTNNRRWSVLDKIENRHYLRIRTWKDFRAALNCKVLLSIMMLFSFVWLAYAIIKTLFLAGFDSNRHDYIIIGGGPAGSLLARRLSDHTGINVLLLEAGLGTQYSLAGKDFFGGPVTRFDIPLFWPTATSVDDFQWDDIPLPQPPTGSWNHNHNHNHNSDEDADSAAFSISLCKGLGGCGIHNAMIYIRALPWDIRQWNLTADGSGRDSSSVSGAGDHKRPGGDIVEGADVHGDWTWDRVLAHYKELERFDSAREGTAAAKLHRHMLAGGDVSGYRAKESKSQSRARALSRGSPKPKRKTTATATATVPQIPRNLGSREKATSSRDRRMSYHGHAGPIATTSNTVHDPVSSLFVDAAVAAGIPFTSDFNDPDPNPEGTVGAGEDNIHPRSGRIGVGYYQFTIANGTRQSVAHVMLGSLLNGGIGGNTTTHMVAESHQTADIADAQPAPVPAAAQPPAAGAGTGTEAGVENLAETTGDQQLNAVPDSISITTSPSTDARNPRGELNLILGATVRRVLLEPTQEFSLMDTVDRATKGLKGDTSTGEDQGLTMYKAVGVEYEVDGVVKVAHLRRPNIKSGAGILEDFRSIILTAGAIMTPKVLMNSGIGPAAVLRGLDVPVPLLVDSPLVGKGLYDHPVVALTARIDHRKLPFPYPSAYMFPMQWLEYVTAVKESLGELHSTAAKGSQTPASPLDFGVLGSPGFSTGAFLRSPYAEGRITDPTVPDIQITLFPNIIEPEVYSRTETEGSDPDSLYSETDCTGVETDRSGTTSASTAACDGDESDGNPDIHMDILFTVALLTPEGTYEVVLDKHNPLGRSPVVQLPQTGPEGKSQRYLSPLDVKRLAWGITQVRAVLRTEPLSTVVVEEVSPAHEAEWGDAQLESWIEHNHYPNNHWVGTARMGPSSPRRGKKAAGTGTGTGTGASASSTENEGAGGAAGIAAEGDVLTSVVDEQLVVRGTTNLYVADAAAIPVIPNGNVHSTVTVVASMAAQFLLNKLQFFSTLLV